MFDPNWLQERYRFDAKARNKQLEWNCVHRFAYRDHVQIVDLGSGTGSNVRYYLEQFPQNQTWHCIEEDPELKVPFWANIEEIGLDLEYTLTRKGDFMQLTKPGHQVEIHFVQGNLLNVDGLVDLLRTDLILANAVFDLFAKSQFDELVRILSHHSLSVLFTLNYAGMRFSTGTAEDAYYIEQYNAHMQREQAFGRGMGDASSAEMEASLQRGLAQVERGDSEWQIAGEDVKMMTYLLGFFEGALSDWWDTAEQKQAFEGWLRAKRKQIGEQTLSAEVHHSDILASFFPRIA